MAQRETSQHPYPSTSKTSIQSFDSSKITFVNKKTDYSVFSYDKTEILDATNTLGYSRTERDKDSFLSSLSDDAVYLSESIVY